MGLQKDPYPLFTLVKWDVCWKGSIITEKKTTTKNTGTLEEKKRKLFIFRKSKTIQIQPDNHTSALLSNQLYFNVDKPQNETAWEKMHKPDQDLNLWPPACHTEVPTDWAIYKHIFMTLSSLGQGPEWQKMCRSEQDLNLWPPAHLAENLTNWATTIVFSLHCHHRTSSGVTKDAQTWSRFELLTFSSPCWGSYQLSYYNCILITLSSSSWMTKRRAGQNRNWTSDLQLTMLKFVPTECPRLQDCALVQQFSLYCKQVTLYKPANSTTKKIHNLKFHFLAL